MPMPTNVKPISKLSQPGSIRAELEKQAWIQNPKLANRLDKRREDGKRQNISCSESARRIRSWQDRTLLVIIAVLLVLLVIRTETAIAVEQEWGLQMKSESGVFTEMAVDTNIQLNIAGLVARVEITQQFTNNGMHWAEGIYRFPLPAGAAVDRMRIKVGERVLEGEIQQKEDARILYQKALEAGQTATIVEQQRRNQFETRLANIGPGESIEITIGYQQNVGYSDFSYHLRLPLTYTPRWEPGRVSNGVSASDSSPAPRLVPAGSTTGHK